jgi:hypothetical protein
MMPVGLIDLRARQAASPHADEARRQAEEAKRRNRLNGLCGSVQSAIDVFGGLSAQQSFDVSFLEHELIPALGLNDEVLHEQPPEFSASFGRGLHLWQPEPTGGLSCLAKQECHWCQIVSRDRMPLGWNASADRRMAAQARRRPVDSDGRRPDKTAPFRRRVLPHTREARTWPQTTD